MSVLAWGSNRYGELGQCNTQVDRYLEPKEVSAIEGENIIGVAAGEVINLIFSLIHLIRHILEPQLGSYGVWRSILVRKRSRGTTRNNWRQIRCIFTAKSHWLAA